jgi:hypothetical protein
VLHSSPTPCNIKQQTKKHSSNICGRFKHGVKLLGRGAAAIKRLDTPLHLEVSECSELAEKAIVDAGGSIKRVFFTKTGLRGVGDARALVTFICVICSLRTQVS